MKRAGALAIAAALSAVGSSEAVADLIPNALPGVTGIPFHQGDNATPGGDGNISNVFDGSGLTVGDPNDPTTWQHNNSWQDGWQGQGGPPGTLIADLGSEQTGLQDMYIWNVTEAGVPDRGTNDADVFYSTNPTVAPTAGTLYDFNSGGWTLLQNIDIPMATADGSDPVNLVVDLSGIDSARYIGFRMNTNHGATNGRIGFAEIQFTVPEPSFLALGGLLAGGLLLRRRRSRA